MAGRKRIGMIASATGGVVAITLAFGPVVFDHLLNRANPPPLDADTSVLLGELAEALRGVAQQRAPEPVAPSPIEAVATGSAETAVAAPREVQSEAYVPAPVAAPVEVLVADVPRAVAPKAAEQPTLPPTRVANLPEFDLSEPPFSGSPSREAAVVERKTKTASIAVFEGEKFELCGYGDFSARTSGDSIVLASNDRGIPGRTFRGFERKLEPRVPQPLWPDCIVAADAHTAAGTTRIAISSIEGR